MGTRLELQTMLESIAPHAYFQPPSQMQYPCIKYERGGTSLDHADDLPYRRTKRYQVTVIDRNPDSELPDLVEALPLCSFDRYFPVDNLNHWVFTLFF